MEDCNNLTANDIIPGVGGVIDKGGTGVKNVAANIRNRAKERKAQKISDSGGYNTLTPFQKSLIPVPAYALNTSTPTAKEAAEAKPVEISSGQVMNYVPYIAGGIVILILAYFIFKH